MPQSPVDAGSRGRCSVFTFTCSWQPAETPPQPACRSQERPPCGDRSLTGATPLRRQGRHHQAAGRARLYCLPVSPGFADGAHGVSSPPCGAVASPAGVSGAPSCAVGKKRVEGIRLASGAPLPESHIGRLAVRPIPALSPGLGVLDLGRFAGPSRTLASRPSARRGRRGAHRSSWPSD